MYLVNLAYKSTERYDLAKFMEFTENGYDILDSYFLDEIRNLPVFGSYVVEDEEGIPDLLSYRIYGNPQYWWILMIYNDIIECDSVEIGKELKYPSRESIEDLYFGLKARAITAK